VPSATRSLVYSVATSLDGFIAGPHGEYDWITHDPAYDFAALYSRFDTGLMGRRTYEVARTRPGSLERMGMKVFVASTTLAPAQHPGVTILSREIPAAVSAIKAQPGKDIWLFGGGLLFRSLLDAGLVDAVDIAVMPILLAGGVPLLPEGRRCALRLKECKTLPSGILSLYYSVSGAHPKTQNRRRKP
jgi:dihydrofolate reductase